MLSTKTHFRSTDTNTMNIKRWKRILHVNGNYKQAWMAILTSDKETVKNCYETKMNSMY